jgi:hypothetical protein
MTNMRPVHASSEPLHALDKNETSIDENRHTQFHLPIVRPEGSDNSGAPRLKVPCLSAALNFDLVAANQNDQTCNLETSLGRLASILVRKIIQAEVLQPMIVLSILQSSRFIIDSKLKMIMPDETTLHTREVICGMQ